MQTLRAIKNILWAVKTFYMLNKVASPSAVFRKFCEMPRGNIFSVETSSWLKLRSDVDLMDSLCRLTKLTKHCQPASYVNREAFQRFFHNFLRET